MRKLSLFNPWRLSNQDLFDDDFGIIEYPENELDMYEEGNNIIVKLKAAGFKQENIDITIENGNTVILTGKIEKEEENKEKKYYRKEITMQSFTRRCDLPVKVDVDNAKADFKNGLLTLTLPKTPESKPRSIKINVKDS
ncbi:MAG: Hsp20/alpha crystallin family protein [Rubrivivax sp.]|nr:Hsp20/alpha crystallin family protein [Rubrivivax sp.]